MTLKKVWKGACHWNRLQSTAIEEQKWGESPAKQKRTNENKEVKLSKNMQDWERKVVEFLMKTGGKGLYKYNLEGRSGEWDNLCEPAINSMFAQGSLQADEREMIKCLAVGRQSLSAHCACGHVPEACMSLCFTRLETFPPNAHAFFA